jgi:hypothetical protein
MVHCNACGKTDAPRVDFQEGEVYCFHCGSTDLLGVETVPPDTDDVLRVKAL